MSPSFPKLAQFADARSLAHHFQHLGFDVPCDPSPLTAEQGSPLNAPLTVGGRTVANRWCIHPMEGWDAHPDGAPSELTLRRWRRFGESGAKWIWGGEAAAVTPEGRANPHQTLATPSNLEGLRQLRDAAIAAHRERYGADDLFLGLQLTHSGRYCRPTAHGLQPRIAYHHPLLDDRVGVAADDDSPVLTDDDLKRLADAYVSAAGLAWKAGFEFVDIKACHGYLLHEFLSARSRGGPYGGDLEGRSRLLREILRRIADEYPQLQRVVRLSVFDTPPFGRVDGRGRPQWKAADGLYTWGFGLQLDDPLRMDLTEPLQLIGMLRECGVTAISATCGSPYYNPHQQRPALYPPSDGYPPPEDPLKGVARHLLATRACKNAYGDLAVVGAGWSYLQEYLPHVAQGVVRAGWADAVGLGRMVLSYPQLPDDVAQGRWARKLVCRTFSDCTTAPRNGLPSGCYPLDDHYRRSPQAKELSAIKSKRSESLE